MSKEEMEILSEIMGICGAKAKEQERQHGSIILLDATISMCRSGISVAVGGNSIMLNMIPGAEEWAKKASEKIAPILDEQADEFIKVFDKASEHNSKKKKGGYK